ncbi:hypothetical protein H8959_009187 [Pygathrix nigripes]
MVKLGNNFAEKGTKQPLLEDGFDTIPLMTPLDVNQLQFPPPDKVVVKTKTEYEPDRKKGKARPPQIAEFTCQHHGGTGADHTSARKLPGSLSVATNLSILFPVPFVARLRQQKWVCVGALTPGAIAVEPFRFYKSFSFVDSKPLLCCLEPHRMCGALRPQPQGLQRPGSQNGGSGLLEPLLAVLLPIWRQSLGTVIRQVTGRLPQGPRQPFVLLGSGDDWLLTLERRPSAAGLLPLPLAAKCVGRLRLLSLASFACFTTAPRSAALALRRPVHRSCDPAETVSVLVLFALAFLTCVVFLVVYKVYKYDRACPDGFVLKNTQCIPEGLESYYAEQDSSAREKFYTVINHYNLAKQSITRSVSPWMSVLSEEKLSEQETEAAEKSA